MKKLLALLLVLTLSIAIISGCKKKAEDVSAPPEEQVSESIEEQNQEEVQQEENQTDNSQNSGETASNTQAPAENRPASTPPKQAASHQPSGNQPSNGQSSGGQAQATPTPKPENTPKPSVAVSTVISSMVSALGEDGKGLSEMPSDLYASVYQIDPSKFDSVSVYGAAINVRATEVIVIKAKDATGVKEAQKALENRKAVLDQQWSHYLPDQYELVKNGVIKTNGLYVTLVIAPDHQRAVNAFNQILQ